MTKPPVTYICRSCGTPEVLVDAYAKWNPATQQNELMDTYDSCTCGSGQESCGGNETKCVTVAVDQDVQVHSADDNLGRWMASYAEGHVFPFDTEEKACFLQREWREHVGRDPLTGEIEP